MVKYERLRLAVKYGLNDKREGLSTVRATVWILYGHVWCRKFSCNFYFVSIAEAHFTVYDHYIFMPWFLLLSFFFFLA